MPPPSAALPRVTELSMSSKWARTYTRAGVWQLTPNTYDRTVQVKVTTNGRCIVGVAVR
jgi:hypothetical protein